MDVMGRVFLASGLEVKVVTGIDDHSRFIVCAKAVLGATARPVCQALGEALARHGVPSQILTDNGKVFTARFGMGPGPVMFDRRASVVGVAPRAAPTGGECGQGSHSRAQSSTPGYRRITLTVRPPKQPCELFVRSRD
jgi:hypothetical protein